MSDMSVPRATRGTSVMAEIGTGKQRNPNHICGIATNLTVMDWGEVGLRLAATAQNFEWIRIIIPFTFWDLRIEGRNAQLLAFCCRVASETCRVQTYPTSCAASGTRWSAPVNDRNTITENAGLPRHSASRERSVPSILSHNLSIGGNICWVK